MEHVRAKHTLPAKADLLGHTLRQMVLRLGDELEATEIQLFETEATDEAKCAWRKPAAA